MKRQFAVIGCGRFGSSLAKTLYALGHEVMAVDKSEERVQNISDFTTDVGTGDLKFRAFLKSGSLAQLEQINIGYEPGTTTVTYFPPNAPVIGTPEAISTDTIKWNFTI